MACVFTPGGYARSHAAGGRVYRVLAVLGNPANPYALRLQWLGTLRQPAARPSVRWVANAWPGGPAGPHVPARPYQTPDWYYPCRQPLQALRPAPVVRPGGGSGVRPGVVYAPWLA